MGQNKKGWNRRKGRKIKDGAKWERGEKGGVKT